jgi:glycosyltransferase involved in cell wall biosynthesis
LRLAFLGDPNSVHTRRWITFFAGRGHSVHLLVPAQQEIRAGVDERIAIHRFRTGARDRQWAFRALTARRSLRGLIDRVGPDVVHAHFAANYGGFARLAGFHPYVVSVWGSDVLVVPRISLRSRGVVWLALHGADLVTAGSNELAEAAVGVGARRERMRIVPFGVETERFAPGAASPALRHRLDLEGRRVIFSPRAIRPLYRHDTVVAALARLPDDVVMIATTTNADPACVGGLRERIASLGVADRVRILDRIPDDEIVDVFRLADVVVSVPESDGQPVSVYEAMACARPVVASDLPGLRSLLGPLAPELLVPVGDVAATARALDRALSLPPAERGRLGTALRRTVIERADHVASMLRMEDHYRWLATPAG